MFARVFNPLKSTGNKAVLGQVRFGSSAHQEPNNAVSVLLAEQLKKRQVNSRIKMPEFKPQDFAHLRDKVCVVKPELDEYWPLIRLAIVYGPLLFVPKICVWMWEE